MATLLDRLDWTDELAALDLSTALDWCYVAAVGDPAIGQHLESRTHTSRRQALVAHVQTANAKVARNWTPAAFVAASAAAAALHTFDAQDPAPALAEGVARRSAKARKWLESVVRFDDLDDYPQWPPLVQSLVGLALCGDPRWGPWLDQQQRAAMA